jgi:hypothetical protein
LGERVHRTGPSITGPTGIGVTGSTGNTGPTGLYGSSSFTLKNAAFTRYGNNPPPNNNPTYLNSSTVVLHEITGDITMSLETFNIINTELQKRGYIVSFKILEISGALA